jgi:hypothetical protein
MIVILFSNIFQILYTTWEKYMKSLPFYLLQFTLVGIRSLGCLGSYGRCIIVNGWFLYLLKIWSSMRSSCKRGKSESKDVLFIVGIHDERDCSKTLCGGDCHKSTYVNIFVHYLWFAFPCLLWSFSLQSNRILGWKHIMVTLLCCHIVFFCGWSFLNLKHVKTTKDFHNVFAYYGKW